MGRTLGAVVAGYITMFAVVFITFAVAYVVMGAERAYQPGSYGVSALWLVTTLVLSLIAAIAGGCVCARIGRGRMPVGILAGLVIVLGLIMAVPALNAPADPAAMQRPGDVGMFEAIQKAQQPDWVTLVNPLLGAVGVLLGGRRP